MRYLYKIFDKYLPKANYNNEPIIFMLNNDKIIYVYLFDRKRKSILISDMYKENYKYKSINDINLNDWKIIHQDDLNKLLFPYLNYNELPF